MEQIQYYKEPSSKYRFIFSSSMTQFHDFRYDHKNVLVLLAKLEENANVICESLGKTFSPQSFPYSRLSIVWILKFSGIWTPSFFLQIGSNF